MNPVPETEANATRPVEADYYKVTSHLASSKLRLFFLVGRQNPPQQQSGRILSASNYYNKEPLSITWQSHSHLTPA
jgi:hypothetical protein